MKTAANKHILTGHEDFNIADMVVCPEIEPTLLSHSTRRPEEHSR